VRVELPGELATPGAYALQITPEPWALLTRAVERRSPDDYWKPSEKSSADTWGSKQLRADFYNRAAERRSPACGGAQARCTCSLASLPTFTQRSNANPASVYSV